MFVFYPTQDYSNTKLIDQKQETPNVSINNSQSENKVFSEEGFMSFSESDFDFYVYRAHVLSSQMNADKLKEKIIMVDFHHLLSLLVIKKNFLQFMLDLS